MDCYCCTAGVPAVCLYRFTVWLLLFLLVYLLSSSCLAPWVSFFVFGFPCLSFYGLHFTLAVYGPRGSRSLFTVWWVRPSVFVWCISVFPFSLSLMLGALCFGLCFYDFVVSSSYLAP